MSTSRASIGPEQRFVCGVLRSLVLDQPPPRVPSAIRWDDLQWILDVNRLIPIVLKAVQHPHLHGCDVPVALREVWERYSLRVLAKNSSDTRAAVELAHSLSQAGVSPVGMRGVSLMHRVYKDPMLRPMSDVDMLIPKGQRETLIEFFSREATHPFQTSTNQLVCDVRGTKIEIHWHMLKRLFAFALDFGSLFEDSETIDTQWGELRVLSLENELIGVICHHFIHHDMDTLLKVLDVAWLAVRPELDWDYIRDWAERSELQSVFLFTLCLVDHLLETRLCDRFARRRGPRYAPETFAPYESRLFGSDRRRDWGKRLATSISIADSSGHKLRMLLRFARKKDVARLLARPFERRQVVCQMRDSIS